MPRKIKVQSILADAILNLEIEGDMLSNIAYNLSQHHGRKLTERDCQCLRESFQGWDAAKSKLRELTK